MVLVFSPNMAEKLDFVKIQDKWKKKYKESRVGEAEIDKNKKKWFMIWAYTTASGFIHMGHMRGYSYTDVICRYKRMNGHNVLLPAGAHATGNGAITKAYRLKQKDPKLIAEFKENRVSDEDLKRIEDPEEFVNFFCKQYIDNFRTFGFIGDWERRFINTISPDYNKFITWQFLKLKELELLTQKPYFATACVKCGPVAVDPSEMDLQKGGNAEQQEFTLIKLRYKEDDQYIICATLRPETMYGQTNIWIDPDTAYAKIRVPVLIKGKKKKEIWIVSRECAEKLKYQKDGIEDAGDIHSKEMMGNYCSAPAVNREVIILPSDFCDPNIGTGIVTSVPSDAPHDYIALEDLKTTKSLWEKYGLPHEELKRIELIPIIKTPGYGDFPAKEICERLGIESQHDLSKLEQAKKEIYKLGFHTGTMNRNCGPYAGMKVTEAKDKMKQDLIEEGDADIMYDLSEEVVCRCGNPVVIKRYDDQWFIRYSDEELTEKSKGHAKTMNIYPESYRENMRAALEWFEDRACARQGKWMGTVFPFDKKYIIEAISDSTLYPIYYLVSLYVNEGKIKEENLTEEFFDFVFLGKGDPADVSKECKVDAELLKKIQEDVKYWYPLDINLGGKEHQRVHFPPFVMNHVAILPKEYWPKGIFVNYWIVGKEGGKLSKSKGGTLPIPGVAQEFGVDNMRLYYTNAGSPFADVEFEESTVRNYNARLEKIWALFNDLLETIGEKKENRAGNNKDEKKPAEENSTMDRWIESKFNSRLKNITEKMELFDFKLSTDEVYFNMYKDLMMYKNTGGSNRKIISSILNKWTRMMSIFTPFIAEEMWEKLGNKELAAVQDWPEVEDKKIDKAIEAAEEMFMKTREDIAHVLKLAKISEPKEIRLYVASEWKYRLIEELESILEKTKNQGQVIKEVMSKEEFKKHGKDVAAIVQRIIKNGKLPAKAEQKTELTLLKDAKENLEKEFKSRIKIIKAEESKEAKAGQAMPGKPAILVA
ncbi:leucine--tRNA ligase [Candidatus Woesearchaeota archaeon]|nr:leucine--tRNA ligase [Candidatus Woesearchaeota archaeon]